MSLKKLVITAMVGLNIVLAGMLLSPTDAVAISDSDLLGWNCCKDEEFGEPVEPYCCLECCYFWGKPCMDDRTCVDPDGGGEV